MLLCGAGSLWCPKLGVGTDELERCSDRKCNDHDTLQGQSSFCSVVIFIPKSVHAMGPHEANQFWAEAVHANTGWTNWGLSAIPVGSGSGTVRDVFTMRRYAHSNPDMHHRITFFVGHEIIPMGTGRPCDHGAISGADCHDPWSNDVSCCMCHAAHFGKCVVRLALLVY